MTCCREHLTFEEISRRYGQKYPAEKALTLRGLLSPSTSPRQLVIRAVFAHQTENSPLEDLLFVSDDNERKTICAVSSIICRTGKPSFICGATTSPNRCGK